MMTGLQTVYFGLVSSPIFCCFWMNLILLYAAIYLATFNELVTAPLVGLNAVIDLNVNINCVNKINSP